MHLGLDAPGFRRTRVPVVPAEVGADRGVLLAMAGVIAAAKDEAAQGLELALNMRSSQLA